MSSLVMGVYKQAGLADQCIPIQVDETGSLVVQGSGGGSSTGLTNTELRAAPIPVSLSSDYTEDSPHSSGATGSLVFGVRSDTDGPTADNGDYTVLSLDEECRLKVSTNPTLIKGSAGTIYNVAASNTGGSAAFVKLYDRASVPTVGTDMPSLTLTVPAGGHMNMEFGPLGHRFTSGIAISITNLQADASANAVAINQIKLLVSYI